MPGPSGPERPKPPAAASFPAPGAGATGPSPIARSPIAPSPVGPSPDGPSPIVILVQPQLGENIGMAARAMANCGLDRLRLVRPRDGWPNPAALAAAAGADWVIAGATVFATTAEAVADLGLVFAATARPRDMVKDTLAPERAAAELRRAAAGGVAAGILFGPEASGLANDDVALADAIVTAPLDPRFTSLNLAMAVLLTGYAWRSAGAAPVADAGMDETAAFGPPATKADLIGLFEHLERELDASGFLRVTEKRPQMVLNLRAILQRARLTHQEVQTLRGVIASLTRFGGNRGRPSAEAMAGRGPRPSTTPPSSEAPPSFEAPSSSEALGEEDREA